MRSHDMSQETHLPRSDSVHQFPLCSSSPQYLIICDMVLPRYVKHSSVKPHFCGFQLQPIFTKGDPSLFENYRPISLLPAISKVLEKIIENIVVTGKIEGERSRGRPRLNFMKSLSQLLKISEVEIIERTRHREEWRTMTANVRTGYGT